MAALGCPGRKVCQSVARLATAETTVNPAQRPNTIAPARKGWHCVLSSISYPSMRLSGSNCHDVHMGSRTHEFNATLAKNGQNVTKFNGM